MDKDDSDLSLHFNTGNKHAKKEHPKTAQIYLRVTPEDKNLFVSQAQKEGKKLSEWALEILRSHTENE